MNPLDGEFKKIAGDIGKTIRPALEAAVEKAIEATPPAVKKRDFLDRLVIGFVGAWQGIAKKLETRSKIKNPLKGIPVLRDAQKIIREEIAKGSAELITVNHPNPKLAQMARDLEEMLEHPLAKRFGRVKPKLVVHDGLPLSDGGDEAVKLSPALVGKYIAFGKNHVEALESAEIKGIMGHELAHRLAQDANPRFRGSPMNYFTETEYAADRLGIILSGEPQAMITGTQKIMDKQTEGMPEWVKKLQNNLHDVANMFGKLHPLPKPRAIAADILVDRMQDPAERSFVEQEIEKRLQARHDELFGHHKHRS